MLLWEKVFLKHNFYCVTVILESRESIMDEIHQKIKNLRIEQSLTLKDLSEKTNLSVSFLSQIERGSSSLAITSLKKIADAFEVPITFFFDTEVNHNYMLPAKERKPFKLEGAPTTYSRFLVAHVEQIRPISSSDF